MTTEELDEIKQFVLRELPRALEQDPRFVVFVEGIVSEKFPRRDEFARLLDELAASRWENRERFGWLDDRFNEHDGRFDKVEGQLQRLEKLGLGTRYELMKHGQQLAHLRKRSDGLDAWLKVIEGNKGRERGKHLEDVFATALRFGLRNPDLSPEQIRLRVKLTDHEGLVYVPGFTTEVDIVMHDHRWTVFEIKASAEVDDVPLFASKLKLLRAQQPDKEIRGVLFSCHEDGELKQRCRDYQIEFIEPISTLGQDWVMEWAAKDCEEDLVELERSWLEANHTNDTAE
jgi:hypothetical protein